MTTTGTATDTTAATQETETGPAPISPPVRTEHTALATARCGDVLDPASGLPRVQAAKCGTCIFRPGNRMHLPPGRRDLLVRQALAERAWIVCHDTLPDTGNPVGTQAVCRGFWDLHARDSWGCRLAIALGGPVFAPPTDVRTPAPSKGETRCPSGKHASR